MLQRRARSHAHRRRLPNHQRHGRSRSSTRLGPALCRCVRPVALACPRLVPATRQWLSCRRSGAATSPLCRDAIPKRSPRRDHLSASSPTCSWLDRAIAQQLSIPRHRIRFSGGSLLHSRIQSNLATGFGRRSSRITRHRWPAKARLRHSQPSTTRTKLDTFSPSVVTQAELVGVAGKSLRCPEPDVNCRSLLDRPHKPSRKVCNFFGTMRYGCDCHPQRARPASRTATSSEFNAGSGLGPMRK